MKNKYPVAFMFILICGFVSRGIFAAENPETELHEETQMTIAHAMDNLAALEKKVSKKPPVTRVQFRELSDTIEKIWLVGKQCVSDANDQIQVLDRDLQILNLKDEQKKSSAAPQKEGEQAAEKTLPVVAESPKIASKRKDLEKQKIQLKEQLVECSLLMVHGKALDRTLQHHKEVVLARRVLSREKNIVQLFWDMKPSSNEKTAPLEITPEVIAENVKGHGVQLFELLSVIVFGLMAGLLLRRQVRRRIKSAIEQDGNTFSALSLSFSACSGRFAPLLIAMLAGSLFMLVQPMFTQSHVLRYTLYDITWFVAISLAIRIFLQPCKPAANVLGSPPELLHRIGRNLKFLALFLFIHWLLPEYIQAGLVSQEYGPLAGILISALTVITGVRILSLARHVPGWFFSGYWWWLAAVLLLGGMLAIMLGYFNLGNLLIRGTILTPVFLAVTLLLHRLLRLFLDGLQTGELGWQKKIRSVIGLQEDDPTPGVGWLRLLGLIILWGLFVITLLHIWDVVEAGEGLIRQYIFQGVAIFGIKIIPARILLAIMFLSLLLAVTRWIKHQMMVRWLKHTHLDQGAKDALVTTVGYVGVAVAIFVALSLAGLNLSNLSLVVGALSVGIGFGLQNVVNNFVSGLILLVERPVKRDDWIVVNGTEGIVRRISIRSTLLETFDGSDVIVPNSELISGQVTNWMLKNRWGRVRIPVGVAYGTDVQLVTELLLKAANEHEDVITDRSDVSKPSVVFNEFGADSLNFELRANVKDVKLKTRVLSDINYAIEAAFREAGIEIPYAQRDLHLDEPVRVELTRKGANSDESG